MADKKKNTAQPRTLAEQKTPSTSSLIPFMRDFRAFSTALLVIGELSPERMTLSQTVFFIIAGMTEINGGTPTFSAIKETIGDTLNRSLHTTYRILMEPSKAFPNGLGWLQTEVNPNDNRVKFITLTAEGRKVMEAVGRAIQASK
jgi:hypothetical protein